MNPRFTLTLTLSAFVLFAPSCGKVLSAEAKKKASASQTNDDEMWVAKPLPASFPVNVTHHTYPSAAMKREVGYCVYLPPGYAKDTTRRYPVIYHLHGATGNETRTTYNAEFLHAGILAGRWPEIIMVFPNGGRATMYQDSADGRFPAETTFVKELMPHVDATYRTIADRKGRCIEGFSMGGRGSTHLAMRHPQHFCSLFNQSGNVYHTSEMARTASPKEWPVNYLGSDPAHLLANDPFANLTKNLAAIKAGLRIQVACGTADDGHLKTVREYHEALTKAGVEHGYFEVEGLDHNQRKMVDGRRDTWFNFHVESLRRAGAELHYLKKP
ncbi:MAG: alpha/beta hydrolase-fold protein [Limisphaerales bacterium]